MLSFIVIQVAHELRKISGASRIFISRSTIRNFQATSADYPNSYQDLKKTILFDYDIKSISTAMLQTGCTSYSMVTHRTSDCNFGEI